MTTYDHKLDLVSCWVSSFSPSLPFLPSVSTFPSSIPPFLQKLASSSLWVYMVKYTADEGCRTGAGRERGRGGAAGGAEHPNPLTRAGSRRAGSQLQWRVRAPGPSDPQRGQLGSECPNTLPAARVLLFVYPLVIPGEEDGAGSGHDY